MKDILAGNFTNAPAITEQAHDDTKAPMVHPLPAYEINGDLARHRIDAVAAFFLRRREDIFFKVQQQVIRRHRRPLILFKSYFSDET